MEDQRTLADLIDLAVEAALIMMVFPLWMKNLLCELLDDSVIHKTDFAYHFFSG